MWVKYHSECNSNQLINTRWRLVLHMVINTWIDQHYIKDKYIVYRPLHDYWLSPLHDYIHSNYILRGYHMGGSVIWFLSNEWWCDITNERGTSEWVISHQHEFDKIISQCHPCDYLFIIYHNTRTNRNFVHTYHSHIYYTSTYCHFLTLQIAVCLSCQTQQAMHNALCDVLWPKQNY